MAAAGLVALSSLLVACGTSGRALRDPAPGATAPPRKPDVSSQLTTAAPAATDATTPDTQVMDTTPAADLALASNAWASGESIPVTFTCQGAAQSPPLTISGVPAGAVELVLLVRDQTDQGYLQWAVAGIDPQASSFPAGAIPSGARLLYNDGDVTAWRAPCPRAGTGRHTYEFSLSALAQPSGLEPKATPAAIDAVVGGAIATTMMTGTYARA